MPISNCREQLEAGDRGAHTATNNKAAFENGGVAMANNNNTTNNNMGTVYKQTLYHNTHRSKAYWYQHIGIRKVVQEKENSN